MFDEERLEGAGPGIGRRDENVMRTCRSMYVYMYLQDVDVYMYAFQKPVHVEL